MMSAWIYRLEQLKLVMIYGLVNAEDLRGRIMFERERIRYIIDKSNYPRTPH